MSLSRPYIYKEIVKAIKINKKNIDQIMSKPLRHQNLKTDYDDLRRFILKLLKEQD
jgi:transcription initiation factor TFIIIB Brf1 subunit/transcription initiation factor TFIIB